MRRSLYAMIPALLLSACLSAANRADPDDVLRLSTVASQQLLSARFEGDLEFRANEPVLAGLREGSAEMSGILQDGGRMLDFSADIRSAPTDASQGGIQGSARVIVAGQDQVYVRIDSLEGFSGGISIPLMDELAGIWWKMPASGLPTAQSALTPDPQFLQLQSQSVIVTKDRGFDTINGRRAHHYDVTADKQKLAQYLTDVAQGRGQNMTIESALDSIDHLSMQGELWIDAETHVLHRVRWNIHSTDEQFPLEIVFLLSMSEHNVQVNIQAPENAQELPSDSILIPPALRETAPAS